MMAIMMQEGLHQQQRELGRHLQEQQAYQLRAEEAALQAGRMLLSLCTPLEGPIAVTTCQLCLLMFTFGLVCSRQQPWRHCWCPTARSALQPAAQREQSAASSACRQRL